MKLNSFCVVVFKYGFVFEHLPPQNINEAACLFRIMQDKYLYKVFESNYFAEQSLNGIDGYNDKWIEDRVKMWKGNTEIVRRILVHLSWAYEKGSVRIELKHSSVV